MEEQKVGDHVIYVDERSVEHHALVTTSWGPTCVNLVFVSDDDLRTDNYGRQVERRSSSVHKSRQEAHGNYWKLPDE